MITNRLKVDVNNHAAPDIIARIGEGDTRQIVFLPGYYDEEGEFQQLTIEADNIFARFRMVKPDNTFVIVDMSLLTPTSDPVEFIVTLTPEMSQISGLCFYDLRIGDGETVDTFLYSAGGRFIVDDDMLTDEMIESVAAVNGLVFPDDFLTSADLEDYATKEYVEGAIEEAISDIPDPSHAYSTTEKVIGTWIDGKPVYEITYIFENAISIAAKDTWTDTGVVVPYIKKILTADGYRDNTNCMPLNAGLDNSNHIVVMQFRSASLSDFKGFTITYIKTTD